jgi:hypothetical protein
MMRQRTIKIREAEFRMLWSRSHLSRTDLAVHFGCSVSSIDTMRVALGLPRRKSNRRRPTQTVPDPTPEELEERKAECRARHYAERRQEPDAQTCREWRQSQRVG